MWVVSVVVGCPVGCVDSDSCDRELVVCERKRESPSVEVVFWAELSA